MRGGCASLLPLLASTTAGSVSASPAPNPTIHAVTATSTNDLLALLKSAGHAVNIASSWRDAISVANPGDGLLLLADGYPKVQTATPVALWTAAAAKRLKVFLEYPAELPLNTSWVPPPPSPPPPGMTPCLPRPANLTPHKGFPAHFEYRNHDEALCAPRGNKVWINTSFVGQQCGDRDDIIWQHLVTKHPRPGLPANACSWSGNSTPEYAGTGCGIAPQWSSANRHADPGTRNVSLRRTMRVANALVCLS